MILYHVIIHVYIAWLVLLEERRGERFGSCYSKSFQMTSIHPAACGTSWLGLPAVHRGLMVSIVKTVPPHRSVSFLRSVGTGGCGKRGSNKI